MSYARILAAMMVSLLAGPVAAQTPTAPVPPAAAAEPPAGKGSALVDRLEWLRTGYVLQLERATDLTRRIARLNADLTAAQSREDDQEVRQVIAELEPLVNRLGDAADALRSLQRMQAEEIRNIKLDLPPAPLPPRRVPSPKSP